MGRVFSPRSLQVTRMRSEPLASEPHPLHTSIAWESRAPVPWLNTQHTTQHITQHTTIDVLSCVLSDVLALALEVALRKVVRFPALKSLAGSGNKWMFSDP